MALPTASGVPMPYLQIRDDQVPLRPGDMSVGTGAGCDVRVGTAAGAEGPGAAPVAIVHLADDKHVSIRRASPASVVKVNGVQLGAEPSPLIHGDKIELAGQELFFGEDRRGGSTQMLSPTSVPELLAQRPRGVPARPTVASGGRLVSLVDGREYPVPPTGITIGRDASCDVVVPSNEVSRRHAEIAPGEGGYVLSDTSTNGVLVNGVRIEKSQLLGRGDVLRVGNEEFRFYADVAAGAPGPAAPAAPATPAAAAPPPAAPAAPVFP
ncbi:MAG TPA: FHA domain-containing protein, partial [Gemmatimonadaceae bacterium]|nr:FHA domain-containing protein [Gemmatimonadaceae bacterium]